MRIMDVELFHVPRPHRHFREFRDVALGEFTVKIADAMAPMPGPEIMQAMSEMIALHVDTQGLEHLPKSGPVLVVANLVATLVRFIALRRVFGARP